MHRDVVRFALVIGAAPWVAGAYAHVLQTGVEGTVSVLLSAPGAQRPGASGGARLADAAVHLRDREGHVVAQAASNEKGHFILRAPAGEYQIQVRPLTSPFPRCKASHVRVSSNGLTRVDIVCDSGIR